MGCGASHESKDCGGVRSSLPTTPTGAGHLVEKQGAGGDLGPNARRTQGDNSESNAISTFAKLAPVLGMAMAATTPLLDFVPFGAGAALGKLLEIAKDRADQAVTNTDNCRRLLQVVDWVRGVLVEVPAESVRQGAEQEARELQAALQGACDFLQEFGPTTFWQRVKRATIDGEDFARHNDALRESVSRLTTRLVLKGAAALAAAPPSPSFAADDDAAALRDALRELGGSADPERALAAVAKAGRMEELKQRMPMGMRVQMQVVQPYLSRLAREAGRLKLPDRLPLAMREFWWEYCADAAVGFDTLFRAVWSCAAGQAQELCATIRSRAAEVLENGGGGSGQGEGGDDDRALLRLLLQGALDLGANDMVHWEVFYKWHQSCLDWALQEGYPPPEDVPACLVLLARHFTPQQLSAANKEQVARLRRLLQPLNLTYDAASHITRFQRGSRTWLFRCYLDWLAKGPKDPCHRALVIYGAPGLGKSTIAAALVSRRAVVEGEESGGEAAGGGGTEGAGRPQRVVEVPPVSAYFFCKHNDAGNRSDPVRLMRTLACQLGEALPCLRRHLLALSPGQVAGLGGNVEEAFNTLLLEPLSAVQDELKARAQPVVVVIDALDEIATANGDNSSSGNPLLRLLREHFRRLPQAVRLLLTSRPEPHITAVLDATFRPMSIQPDDPRHLADLRQLITAELRGRLVVEAEPGVGGGLGPPPAGTTGATATGHTSAGAGGGQHPHHHGDSKGLSGPAHRPPTEQELQAAVQVLMKKSEGVFVYLARLLEGLAAEDRLTLAQLQAFPQGLDETYTAFLAKHVGRQGSPDHEAVTRLLQVLLAAQEPPTLRLLAAAWNNMGLPLPPATEAAAKKKSIWRMRMDDAEAEVEERLQLLGSLYVVREAGQVHVFHKSFHDFLLKPKLAGGRVNAYRCNPLPVHTALAAVVLPLASVAAAKPLGLQPMPLPPRGNADTDVNSSGSNSSSSSSLTNYAVRYAARHLVVVGNDTMGNDARLLEVARAVLSVLLADFDFVAAAFKDGHGHTLIRSVVELAEPRSPEVADAVRWLLNRQHELYTAKGVSEVVNTALRCPLSSLALQRAQAWVRERAAAVPAAAAGGAGCCWLARRVLGRTGQEWSLCTVVIKIQNTTVSWSPDGSTIATMGDYGGIHLWDVVSGERVAACTPTIPDPADWVRCVRWSPDGRRLASGGSDVVRLWDAASGLCTAELKGHEDGIQSVAWSPDGQRLASCSDDNTIRLWDTNSGQCTGTLEEDTEDMWSVVWSPDGRYVACGSGDGTLHLWDPATDECTSTTLEGHDGDVMCMAWSPDGRLLASGGEDGVVRLWDAASGECTGTMEGHKWEVGCLAWRPDGRALASGGYYGNTCVWDVANSQCTATLEADADWVKDLDWSPDGRHLACGYDTGNVCLWDVTMAVAQQRNGKPKGHVGQVRAIAWSPDGRLLASGGADCKIRLWDTASGQCTGTMEAEDEIADGDLCWSPDGRSLASTSGCNGCLLDALSGQRVSTLEGLTQLENCVAWSPDGKQLAGGADDHAVHIWDVTNGTCTATLEGHTGCVLSLAWNPDGRALASGSDNDTAVRLWHVSSGTCTATLEYGDESDIRQVAWSPDGRLVAGRSAARATTKQYGTILLWDAISGQCTATLRMDTYAGCVAWSPDSRVVASGWADGTIRLWDVAGGTCTATLEGHTGWVRSVCWSPDGSTLASASDDSTIRMWQDVMRREGDAGQHKEE